MWHLIQHWIAYVTGSENTSGAPPNYNFWSGFGSDIGEFGIVAGLAALVRRHNCHAKGCPRIGRYQVPGTTYVVCRRHHPEGHPTAAHIREQYHLYLGKRPGRG